MLFKNLEEVKVSIRGDTWARHGRGVHENRELGLIVSLRSRAHKRTSDAANTSSPVADGLRAQARGLKVIGSSEQVHVVDALAITGDEGRGSLRKAPGSWQTSFDPEMSEWGNPARKGYSSLNL